MVSTYSPSGQSGPVAVKVCSTGSPSGPRVTCSSIVNGTGAAACAEAAAPSGASSATAPAAATRLNLFICSPPTRPAACWARHNRSDSPHGESLSAPPLWPGAGHIHPAARRAAAVIADLALLPSLESNINSGLPIGLRLDSSLLLLYLRQCDTDIPQ